MGKNPFGPKGWRPERLGDLTGKTFVVTGANAGAGFQASRTLLAKGAQVVMMNRSVEKSKAAIADLKNEFGDAAAVTFIRMNLASLESVRQAASELLAKVPNIHALICNAAIAQVPQQEFTADGFESQFGVNHLGHFLLCGLVFERIENTSGRVVVVGSNGYKMGLKRVKFEDLNFDQDYTAWSSYAQSKLAQMIFAYELQRRVQAAGKTVEVQVCHPGASRTNLIATSGGFGTRLLWALMSPFAQSAEKGSWPSVMCATEHGLKSQTYYGPTRFEMVGPIGECPLEQFTLDQDDAEKLWTTSEQMTACSWSP